MVGVVGQSLVSHAEDYLEDVPAGVSCVEESLDVLLRRPATAAADDLDGYSPSYYSAFGPYGYRGLGYGSYREPTTGTLKFQITPKTDTKAQVYIKNALASEFKHKRSLLGARASLTERERSTCRAPATGRCVRIVLDGT